MAFDRTTADPPQNPRRSRWAPSAPPFPFGKPLLALTVIALVTGVVLLARPPRPAADLTIWTFTPADAAADRAAAIDFTRRTGHTVRTDLLAAAAMDVRLESLFMAGLRPAAEPSRPDVVELEVESVGKFLRGPPADVGFLPLEGYLRRGGWLVTPSRLVPYSFAGHVFGLPLDLHPVTLVYRRDLIDLSAADTWPKLRVVCLRCQQSQVGHHYALGLPSTSPDVLLVLLQQRHVELVDAHFTPHLTDPAVVDTLCWYARAAAGPTRIGTDPNPAPGGAAADLAAGDVAALVLADWAVADLERSQPSLAGKLAMVPLPRFDPTDARTASWGGTMAAIPRFCPDPDRAWSLIESTYLTNAVQRYRSTGVLPPLPTLWADPAFHQPDPFFAGQRVAELYVQLAPELPARHTTPYTTTAQNLLAWVLDRAVSRARSGNADLRPTVQTWLSDRQMQLQRLIDFDRRAGRL
jgi:arabinosaccharide transport system substrate-binding protein